MLAQSSQDLSRFGIALPDANHSLPRPLTIDGEHTPLLAASRKRADRHAQHIGSFPYDDPALHPVRLLI